MKRTTACLDFEVKRELAWRARNGGSYISGYISKIGQLRDFLCCKNCNIFFF
uniref:Uncharacterized protein n=1 Tax=Anguilla anguilla TaxID=7936 RepID=A0A0E9WJK1_ANGAN